MPAFTVVQSSIGPGMIAKAQPPSFSGDIVDFDSLTCGNSGRSDTASCEQVPRIALLTPYTGNNLGDAAIQDAMIANVRLRLPGAQFSGITLNCDNFIERHGSAAFPLHSDDERLRQISRGGVTKELVEGVHSADGSGQKRANVVLMKSVLRRAPVLGPFLKTTYNWGVAAWSESRHCVEGYQFLRTQDLLVVSGGGQLDDEWGGPWRHPFALLKWVILARIARVPCAIASVGVGKVASASSRLFMSAALRLARYRSYRDKNSRKIAADLLPRAARDCIVPDLALSLPSSELPPPAGLRSIARGRTIVAISPIAYAKPGSWPHADRALYERYLQQMAHVISHLLERDYFLVIVWSALSDESVIPELVERLDPESKERLARQMHIPTISTWQKLVAVLQDVDFLIASRLHSVILGFVTRRPTVAISFDRKVNWVMEDLAQADYLLQILDFRAEDVIKTLERLALRRSFVTDEIDAYRHQIFGVSALQYDILAGLALASGRCVI